MNEGTTVEVTVDGPIGIVTLQRPERRNAINAAMIEAFSEILNRLETAKDVRVVIIRGAGKAFCSGFDLGEDYGDDRNAEEWRTVLSRELEFLVRVWDFPKPVIAAVHGFALAGGLELALACDITVSDSQARFGVPEIRFGSGFVALFLPWFVGLKKSKELMFTGEDRISAAEALDMGLVNRVVVPERLFDTCLDMARTIASMDTAKITLLKRALHSTANIMGMGDAIRAALKYEIEIECLKSEDSLMFQDILRRDGVKAALAWRDARFGREADHG